MISRAKKIFIVTSVAVSVVFLAFFGYATWLKFFPAKQGYGTFVTTLESQDGSVVGDVYAEYLTKNIFTSLTIVKKVNGQDAIAYKINRDGFFNTLGSDGQITSNSFYGYELVSTSSDYIVVRLLTNGGKDASDSANIIWDQDKGVFEIQRPDMEDEFVSVGTLSTLDGSTLGKVFVLYLNKNDKNILSGLYVVRTANGKTGAIYRINKDGFYNAIGKEMGLPSGNFRGFKLLYLKDDHFAVSLLNADGSVSDKIIKWNYDKQEFEIQK